MKKILAVLMGLALCAVLAPSAYADLDADAIAHVYVDVVANVAMQPLTANVDAGDIQSGEFSAICEFRVDVNLQSVNLSVRATDLWKGDDPLGVEVLPIPLYQPPGAMIAPTNANPTGSGTNIGVFDPAVFFDINGFVALGTNQIEFESSQNNHFSQSVFVTCTWNQDDPEKPVGEYSGFVQLLCLLVP